MSKDNNSATSATAMSGTGGDIKKMPSYVPKYNIDLMRPKTNSQIQIESDSAGLGDNLSMVSKYGLNKSKPKEEDYSIKSLYDQMVATQNDLNDAVNENKDAEKSNEARMRIANIADALGSMINLFGTTAGAKSSYDPSASANQYLGRVIDADRIRNQSNIDKLRRNLQEQAYRLSTANIRNMEAETARANSGLRLRDIIRKEGRAASLDENAKAKIQLGYDKMNWQSGENALNRQSKESISNSNNEARRYSTDENNRTRLEIANKKTTKTVFPAKDIMRARISAYIKNNGGARNNIELYSTINTLKTNDDWNAFFNSNPDMKKIAIPDVTTQSNIAPPSRQTKGNNNTPPSRRTK